MKNLLVTITLLINLTNLYAQSDLLFLVDASGSMAKQNNGETQIDSARKALRAALTEVSLGAQVGLRVYGHRVPQNNKAQSCLDTELLVPLGSETKSQIEVAANNLNVKGYTPIAYSLQQSKKDFDLTKESEKTIILLSDGEETCGGDPVATIKQLIADGFKVKVHTVGFMVDENTARQLKGIADASGGTYYDAKSANQLTDVLKTATKKVEYVQAKDNQYGQKVIRGGATFEEAVTIEPDVEYKLDHVLKKNQYDYFFVELKAGQELQAEVRTYDKGIAIRTDGKTEETNMPYAGIKLINTDKSKEKKENIIGAPFTVKTVNMTADQSGKYFLLIGSEYEPINPEYTTFKYKIVARGDLDTDNDAGSAIDQATKAEFKKYQKNYLSPNDKTDIFAITLASGESFFVGIVPNSNTSNNLKLRVLSEYKEEIFTKSFASNTGGKSDIVSSETGGTYYVEVASDYYGLEPFLEYMIEFRKN